MASDFGLKNFLSETDLGIDRFFSAFVPMRSDSFSLERITFSSIRAITGNHSECGSVRASVLEQSPAYLI